MAVYNQATKQKSVHKHIKVAFFVACFASLLDIVKTKDIYQGDKVLSVSIKNSNDWKIVQQMMNDNVLTVDPWKEPLFDGDDAHLHISRSAMETVTSLLERNRIQYRVIIDDVQRLINQEKSSNDAAKQKRRKREAGESVSNALIGTYATLDETYTWLWHLNDFFPKITELLSIGTTFENRKIMLLKIGIPQAYNKPAIFIEAGIHAREWISPASINFIIHQMYSGYQRDDPLTMQLLSDLDWYILPIANPDGYEFSHSKERLWRKNRVFFGRPDTGNSTVRCYGVDINRNFPFHWGEGGGSTRHCSFLYQGPHAASEKETQAITQFVQDNNQTITAYFTLHSYLQLVMTRYSYAKETYPADHEELLRISKEIVDAINATHGVRYRHGTSSDYLYAYSGGSPDWAKGMAGIKYAYSSELRDRGQYGFVLPIEHIIPSGEEMWEGIKVLARYAALVEVPQDILTTADELPTSTTSSAPKITDQKKTNVGAVTGTASYCHISMLVSLFLLVICLHTTFFQLRIIY